MMNETKTKSTRAAYSKRRHILENARNENQIFDELLEKGLREKGTFKLLATLRHEQSAQVALC
jgi:hypothetical protein